MIIKAILRIDNTFRGIKQFKRIYPGAEITAIDGKICIGSCESCGKPILEGDIYYDWAEIDTCLDCPPKTKDYFPPTIAGGKV